MESTTDLEGTEWEKEVRTAEEEVQTIRKRIFVVRRQVSEKTIFGSLAGSKLLEAFEQMLESHSRLCNILFDYDPEKEKVYRQNILINLRKQAKALNKVLKALHDILASLETKRSDSPVSVSKIFIEDNKLPAPADEENKRARLPISIAEELAELLDLTDKEMATILTISIRTYHRLKLNGLLNPVASERLVLLKELAAYGVEVFEDQANFNQWLRLPLRELSNTSPLNSLDTAIGFNRVKTILERIEYGVYS